MKEAPKPQTAPNGKPAEVPQGTVPEFTPRPQPELRDVKTLQMMHELASRLRGGPLEVSEENLQVARILHETLGNAVDVHNNRYSRARLVNYDSSFLRPWWPKKRPPIAGTTWVELGCGAQNPGAFLFYVLARGAQKGIAVDLDPIQDEPRALKALAEVAMWMLIDPKAITHGDAVSPEEVLRNLAGFDIQKLAAGLLEGLDRSRLIHMRESVYALPVEAASVDVVVSCAFLEHVDDVDRAVAEMARITKPGGWSIHVIDGSDHHRYSGKVTDPLSFLEIETSQPIVHSSNRMRPASFADVFARHGFEVTDFERHEKCVVDEARRARFAEPFRSMPLLDLETIIGLVVARRLPL